MFSKIKRLLIGKPLQSEALNDEKYSVLWGLPILASDAISSVAYAGQEILLVLIPVVGIVSYHYSAIIALCILTLLMILMLSYRQTIDNYPNGGGAYIVAKDNLGVFAGVTAGAALAVDYVMTVAVSISSGVEQIASAFPGLRPLTVELSVLLALLLMLGNLRGIRESSKIFGMPSYLFIFAMLLLLGTGFIKFFAGVPIPEPQAEPGYYGTGAVTLFLLLRAFSNGCTALTGVEAVSNAVPNFKRPSSHNAKKVLLLLAMIIILLFGGMALLSNIYHATPGEGKQALIVQIADLVFGRATFIGSVAFYLVTGSVFLILVLAANTAFSGFPMLVSVISEDGFLPRQLKTRGERLSFSNGIIFLTFFAIVLIIVFRADVGDLIGLYAVGVFISFTLSQTGMLVRWFRHKGKNWIPKALVNGVGALVTGVAVIIIAITKFTEGAWIVIIVIPLMIYGMLKIKKHYFAVAKQLKLSKEELQNFNIEQKKYRNRVIVPIDTFNRSSIRAIRYAMTISDNIVIFSVVLDEVGEKKVRDMYHRLNLRIPLIVRYSPYRKIVQPLLEYIQSEEYKYEKGDMITVLLPEFEVKKWWHHVLHNQTRLIISRELLRHKHIVVSTIPLQLKDDDEIIHSDKYNCTKDKPW